MRAAQSFDGGDMPAPGPGGTRPGSGSFARDFPPRDAGSYRAPSSQGYQGRSGGGYGGGYNGNGGGFGYNNGGGGYAGGGYANRGGYSGGGRGGGGGYLGGRNTESFDGGDLVPTPRSRPPPPNKRFVNGKPLVLNQEISYVRLSPVTPCLPPEKKNAPHHSSVYLLCTYCTHAPLHPFHP